MKTDKAISSNKQHNNVEVKPKNKNLTKLIEVKSCKSIDGSKFNLV